MECSLPAARRTPLSPRTWCQVSRACDSVPQSSACWELLAAAVIGWAGSMLHCNAQELALCSVAIRCMLACWQLVNIHAACHRASGMCAGPCMGMQLCDVGLIVALWYATRHQPEMRVEILDSVFTKHLAMAAALHPGIMPLHALCRSRWCWCRCRSTTGSMAHVITRHRSCSCSWRQLG